MREKGQVIEGNGVQGVRFAKLPLSQFQIAGLGGYGGISAGSSLPLYFHVAQSASLAESMMSNDVLAVCAKTHTVLVTVKPQQATINGRRFTPFMQRLRSAGDL
jgi:hypothetical protein